MKRIKELEQNISRAREKYYNDQPEVSDKIFDAWVDELKTLDPTNKQIVSVGAKPKGPWPKVKHQIEMGSLNKCTTPDELKKWAKDCSK